MFDDMRFLMTIIKVGVVVKLFQFILHLYDIYIYGLIVVVFLTSLNRTIT